MHSFWGFVVTFTDGSEYRETDGPWASMPDKPITKAALVAPGLEPIILEGFKSYCFNNEAVARMPLGIGLKPPDKVETVGEIVAKLLGAVNETGCLLEYRVAKESKGFMIYKRNLEPDQIPYIDAIFKG